MKNATLRLLPLVLLAFAVSACEGERDVPQEEAPAASTPPYHIELETPSEAAAYYAADDVYLLSNFGSGGPTAIDGDGFISRVEAETGEIVELEWISGNLSAPKGMTIVGDTLYVADMDAVHTYDLANGGAPLREIAVDTSRVSFPNDVCAGADGVVYLTDTGLNPDFSSSGTDAVYRLDGDSLVQFAAGADVLQGPNGCWVDDEGLLVATFGANEVLRIGGDGSVTTAATLPSGGLDGIVGSDGTLYVTSWEAGSVYRLEHAMGESAVVSPDTPSPAALALDTMRDRLVVPLLDLETGPPFRVVVVQLEGE